MNSNYLNKRLEEVIDLLNLSRATAIALGEFKDVIVKFAK